MEWYQRRGKPRLKGNPYNNKESSAIQRLKGGASYIYIFFIAFYALQAIAAIIHKKAPIQDLFIAAFIISLVFLIHLIVGLPKIVPIFIGIGFIPHILGLYEIFYSFNSFNGALYGSAFFGYHYDWIVHFFATFCYSVALGAMSYEYLRKGLKSCFIVFIILLFFMSGLGALNESIEFVGYELFGYGKGFLEFGDGDASPNAGPWQNASMDMVNNIIGAAIGIGLFLLIKRSSNPNDKNAKQGTRHQYRPIGRATRYR